MSYALTNLGTAQRKDKMNISELKQKMEFYTDAVYQKGYDLGRDAILEEMEQIADSYWNDNMPTHAAALVAAVKQARGENA